MSKDKERSASDIADIDRASTAATEDKSNGDYDPDDKLSSDTPEQKEAYDRSWNES